MANRIGLLAWGILCSISGLANAQTPASVQSPMRPLGLNLWDANNGKVMVAGSDSTSQSFMNNQ